MPEIILISSIAICLIPCVVVLSIFDELPVNTPLHKQFILAFYGGPLMWVMGCVIGIGYLFRLFLKKVLKIEC